MEYYSIWNRDKLIGMIFEVDYDENEKGLAMYTLSELKYLENFIKLYNLKSERDTENNILSVENIETGEKLSVNDDNIFNEENAPEMVLTFMKGEKIFQETLYKSRYITL